MRKDVKTVNINLDFEHGDFNSSFPFTVTMPADTPNDAIRTAINEALTALEESDPKREEIVHIPSLLNEICKKYGWEWRKFEFDVDMSYS